MILAKLPKKMQEAIASGRSAGRAGRGGAGQRKKVRSREAAKKLRVGKKKKTRR
jgi:hypothetical protein